MSEPISVQLIDRLRAEGVVPMGASCELERRYPSKQERAWGGWSWRIRWGSNGALDHRAGSAFPMKLCVTADRLEVFSRWVATEGCAGQEIIPMSDEDVRNR